MLGLIPPGTHVGGCSGAESRQHRPHHGEAAPEEQAPRASRPGVHPSTGLFSCQAHAVQLSQRKTPSNHGGRARIPTGVAPEGSGETEG